MTGGCLLAIILVNVAEEVGTNSFLLLVVRRCHSIAPVMKRLTGVGLDEAEPLGLDVACVNDFSFACLHRQFPVRDKSGEEQHICFLPSLFLLCLFFFFL